MHRAHTASVYFIYVKYMYDESCPVLPSTGTASALQYLSTCRYHATSIEHGVHELYSCSVWTRLRNPFSL